MSNRYNLGDIIVRLNVGIAGNFSNVFICRSVLSLNLVHLLYDNGLIRGFYIDGINDNILVYLKYNLGKSVIKKLKLISRPGRRVFWTLNTLSLNYNLSNFSGFFVISTSKGLLTSHQCLLSHKTSGEVLLKVYH